MSPTSRQCITPTWEEVEEQARAVALKVRDSGFEPQAVVAIARGGCPPARSLCDLLAVKELHTVRVEHWSAPAEEDREGARITCPLSVRLDGKRVLVVDDVAETGKSFTIAAKHAVEQGASEVRTAALYLTDGSEFTPDYYAEKRAPAWVVFPWTRNEDAAHFARKQLAASGRPLPLKELQHLLVKEHEFYVTAKELEFVLDGLAMKGLAKEIPAKRWGGEAAWQGR